MSQPIQLMVGLANPGREYAKTRHNAGAWWLEGIANLLNVTLKPEAKFHGLYGIGSRSPHTCHLLIPTTFMNESGRSIRSCMNYLKLLPESILVAHDDIDLEVGDVRLKFDGGDGGHNGLKDIIRHLNSKQFYRLRIGVGRPRLSKEVIDYVLEPPSKSDKQTIDQALLKAEDSLPLLLEGHLHKAMQQLNTKNDD